MKTKNLLTGLLLTVLFGFLFSCSKDDDPQPAKTKTPSGNPVSPHSNTQHGTDYFEFKLDGAQISLNNFSYTPPAISFGLATISSDPDYPLYQFIGQFRSLPGSAMSYIMMHLVDSVPVTLGNHSYMGYGSGRYFLTSMITQDGNYLLPAGNCISNIEFIRLDTVDGGKVEGTFSFSSMNLQDNNENLISANHSITDGKFSLTYKK